MAHVQASAVKLLSDEEFDFLYGLLVDEPDPEGSKVALLNRLARAVVKRQGLFNLGQKWGKIPEDRRDAAVGELVDHLREEGRRRGADGERRR